MPIDCGLFKFDTQTLHEIMRETSTQLFLFPATYIYTGADFTHPNHRKKGLNTRLTQYAFDAIVQPTLEHMQKNKSIHLALVYGLTQANTGEDTLLGGRTQGLLTQFVSFVSKIATLYEQNTSKELLISRYGAFKPSFDPTSIECKPLPDDKAIAGYGYVIAYAVEKKMSWREVNL